ncbi:MAG: hypothetical protein ACI9ON_000884 [Limisphaerales bacterium]|jgi:hypothetical protein
MKRTIISFTTAAVVLGACSGGGGSSGSADGPGPVTTTQVQVTDSRGLVSGGAGLVGGSGVDGVGLVGVSGSGLVVGVSGSGISMGTIQDFSSIVINDVAIDTATAQIEISGAQAVLADLRQGQQVLVLQNDGGAAIHVSYRPNLIGPLDAVTVRDELLELGSAVVLGQEVAINAATVYENTDLVSLSPGGIIEISGILAQDMSITATFIRSVGAVSTYTLVGEARSVTSSQFVIGAQAVTYNAASLADFEEGALAEGDVVEVTFLPASVAPGAAVLDADRVTLLERLIIEQNVAVDAEGIVDDFVSPTEFEVQNQTVAVDAATQFFGGSVDDLEDGVRVLARGSINQAEVLVAAELYLESDDTVLIEGPISAIDLSSETVSVLDVIFEVRDLTDFDDFDTLDELLIGDQVEIAGYLDGEAVIAADIERESLGETGAELRGPVGEFDATTGSLRIFGIDLATDAVGTEFQGFAEETLTAAEFFGLLSSGVFVSVSWDNFVSTSDVPNQVSLEDD